LIFEVMRDARARGETGTPLADWRQRMDRVIVVTTPDEMKIARYAARMSPDGAGRKTAEADARVRLAHQIPDGEKAVQADFVLENAGGLPELEAKVRALWERLKTESGGESNKSARGLSLE
jgi:dephospho-CoA kinase